MKTEKVFAGDPKRVSIPTQKILIKNTPTTQAQAPTRPQTSF